MRIKEALQKDLIYEVAKNDKFEQAEKDQVKRP